MCLELDGLIALGQHPQAALRGLSRGFPRDPATLIYGFQMCRDGRRGGILGKQRKGEDSTRTQAESKPHQPAEHFIISAESYLPGGHWALQVNLKPPILHQFPACCSKMLLL